MTTSRCIDGWNEPLRVAERRRETLLAMCRSESIRIERKLGYGVLAAVYIDDHGQWWSVLTCRVTGRQVECALEELRRALRRPADVIRITVKCRRMSYKPDSDINEIVLEDTTELPTVAYGRMPEHRVPERPQEGPVEFLGDRGHVPFRLGLGR